MPTGPGRAPQHHADHWRDRAPIPTVEHRMRMRAYSRALSDLRKAHPTQFDLLYQARLAEAQLDWEAEMAAAY